MQNNHDELNATPTTIIRCARTFPYPVAEVFAAFLDASLLKEWFGPKDSTIGDVHIHPQPGGDYAIEMHLGAKTVWIKGRYTTILPNQRLDFSFFYEPDLPGIGNTEVRVLFHEQENSTQIVLTQVIYKSINPEGRTKGWESGFDRLHSLLHR